LEFLSAGEPKTIAAWRAAANVIGRGGSWLSERGRALESAGDLEPALLVFTAALEVNWDRLEAEPEVDGWAAGVCNGHNDRARTLEKLGRVADALASWKAMLELMSASAQKDPRDLRKQELLATNRAAFASFLARHGRGAEALAEHREVARLRRHIALRDDGDSERRLHVITALTALADALTEQGAHRESLAYARAALAECERSFAEQPESSATWDALASAHMRVANCLDAVAEVEAALPARMTSLNFLKRVVAAAQPSDMNLRRRLSGSLSDVGIDLVTRGDVPGGLVLLAEATDLVNAMRKVTGLPDDQRYFVIVAGKYALTLARSGDAERAEAIARELLEVKTGDPLGLLALAAAAEHRARSDPGRSAQLLDQALGLATSVLKDVPDLAVALLVRGPLYLAHGERERARKDLELFVKRARRGDRRAQEAQDLLERLRSGDPGADVREP